MSDKSAQTAPRKATTSRDERLKAALKANLQRRKAQARDRKATEKDNKAD